MTRPTPSTIAREQHVTQRIDVDAIKCGLPAANDRQAHVITRKSSGCGIDDYMRIECSCGFIGPKRHGHDDWQMTNVRGDESAHLRKFAL